MQTRLMVSGKAGKAKTQKERAIKQKAGLVQHPPFLCAVFFLSAPTGQSKPGGK